MTLEKTSLLLEKTFQRVIDHCREQTKVYYDLFVTMDYTEGRITIMDEDDNILAEEMLFDYAQGEGEKTNKIQCSRDELKQLLRSVVERLRMEGAFEDVFGEPFSISYLANNEEDTNEELLFLHDDVTLLDSPLMEHLDEDLDNFFRSLLGK
ncbi:MAG: hypothetical protein PUI84_05010 [Bacteroidales bacterium]|nr:hypothetical protein [Porphyromonas sp.]MDD6934662.1 hypothetical protein [Bacteroidales bacterium]MDY3101580.1 hypothetical protein [Porphyromonas sp.]